MNQEPEFPFDQARKVTPEENQKFRAAISEQFGLELKKRGRPSKEEEEKYEPISIRLHPKILVWAKKEAEKQGIGYQTVINELLLAQIGRVDINLIGDRPIYPYVIGMNQAIDRYLDI